MNGRFGYLLKNMGLLFVGSFSSKILVFLLVPLYTSVLSTEEYGSYDLLHTTMQMLLPILSLNVIDGVMRFTIGETFDNRREAFTAGIKYIVISFLLTLVGTVGAALIFPNSVVDAYKLPFVLMFAAYALYQLVMQFARGLDDVSGISIAGIISTVVMLLLNIYFLLMLRWGLMGYFYAHILGLVVPTVFLFIRSKMHRYIDFKGMFRAPTHEKEMLRYCAPLMFTTLSWYINSAAGRYVVTWFCGMSVNGIYSVAYKIPSILNAVQSIFIQAWQLSAIKEFGSREGEGFYRQTYQGCQTIMIVLCSSLIMFTRVAAKILFAKEFYQAWVFVPVLLIYIVFNTLSGTIGGVFSATKDSAAFTKSAVAGALANIVLNFPLVYWWGAQGAAIATLISSVVIWAMRMHYSRKHINLHLNHAKYFTEYGLLLAQAILMITVQGVVGYVLQGVLWLTLIAMNLKEVKEVVKRT